MRTTLLFDLDGTLTDPGAGLVGCVRYAFSKLALECPSDEVLLSFVGPPLRRMFASLLGADDNQRIEQAVAYYRERYTDIGVYETRPYDGIDAMLTECARRASAAFVLTSKPTIFAERIVRNLKFDHHFAGVYGPALDGRFDDKGELLDHLLANESITAGEAIVVGDRAADIIAARKNAVRSIGVLWGYGSSEELRDAGADALCAAPGELSDCIQRMRYER